MQRNLVLINFALLVWTPIVVVLFRKLGRRNGTLFAVIGGSLLLPPTGLPDSWILSLFLNKNAAIGLALLTAILVWDHQSLLRFRPSWWDLPILVFSALMWLVAIAGQFVAWDIGGLVVSSRVWFPVLYLAGRLYFGNVDGARRICAGLVIGTLLFVPVVVFETVMGPAWYLRTRIYAILPHAGMIERLGGWRPEGFFDSGLELASWMALAATTAVWLWLGRWWKPRWGPDWGPSLVLVLATLATRGLYGYINLAVGLLVVVLTIAFRTRAVLVTLALVALVYIGLRVSGVWDGRLLAELAGRTGRESTVAVRLAAEDRIIARVFAHNPVFGYGRPLGVAWGPEAPSQFTGSDSGWLVPLWTGGLVGLAAQLAALLLIPTGLALAQPRGRPDRRQAGSPIWGLALFTILYSVDNLQNLPTFPLPALAIGSIIGAAVSGKRGDREPAGQPRREGRTAAKPRSSRFAPIPSAIPILAALACVLYVFGHAHVEGHEEIKFLGSFGAVLLLAAAGWVGAWAAEQPVSLGRLTIFAALFGGLGVSFNLALYPTRPMLTPDILQCLALCGLIVAAWRRAFGNRPLSDALLAVASLSAHFLLPPILPALPGLNYLVAGPPGAGVIHEPFFQVCPWLSVAALGAWAWRESEGLALAASGLFAVGAAFLWWTTPRPGLPVKFPMDLTYALMGSSLAVAAVALSRFLWRWSWEPPARSLGWLGRRWLIFFYVHFALVSLLEQTSVRSAWAVWLVVAAGSLTATWLASSLLEPFARRFASPVPWLVLAALTFGVGLWPGLSPGLIRAVAGVAGVIFAAEYGRLVSLVASLRPFSRASAFVATAAPREPAPPRYDNATRADLPPAVRDPLRDLARFGVLLALLALPEAIGFVVGSAQTRDHLDDFPSPARPISPPQPTPPQSSPARLLEVDRERAPEISPPDPSATRSEWQKMLNNPKSTDRARPPSSAR